MNEEGCNNDCELIPFYEVVENTYDSETEDYEKDESYFLEVILEVTEKLLEIKAQIAIENNMTVAPIKKALKAMSLMQTRSKEVFLERHMTSIKIRKLLPLMLLLISLIMSGKLSHQVSCQLIFNPIIPALVPV